MKGIKSLNVLQEQIQTNENVWLLLYKQGSKQSDCAFRNFENVEDNKKDYVLLSADVSNVKDIHSKYGVNSVPSTLYFENGNFKNIVKGCYTTEQFSAIFEKSVFVSKNKDNDRTTNNVTVYTTPTCSWCTVIKRHLQENGISYREVDVSADQKAAETMVKRSGQQGVPQTDINGQMIVGFDKTRINSLLGIN